MLEPTLDTLLARSDKGDGPQTLRSHLEGVAQRAETFAAAFGGAPFGRWLGYWHDAGKVAPDVQAYLRGETDAARGPDHSSAGMLEAWESLPFLAVVIGGHHSGLDDRDRVKQRVEDKRQEARVAEAHALAERLFDGAVSEPTVGDLPEFLRAGPRGEQGRRLAFWQRMLHSALVDADRLDSEAHGSPDVAAVREQAAPPLTDLRDALERDQQRLIDNATDTRVNRVRAEVYRACLTAAEEQAGFFSLTVPTGGGKTRSVLAFALRHALRHGQRRVVVTLPFTTIIEQNAEEYRQILGRAAVVEHHSAIQDRPAQKNEDADELDRKLTLAAENWDAPVVVTTTVQLFESLFARNNARLRKLHRLARSVIVLDEAQTLPPDLLIPTLEALRFLVEDYGCTVVFCTATQPAFRQSYGDPDHGPYFAGFDIHEITPNPDHVYRELRRVNYDVQTERVWTWAEVAAEMRTAPRALAVVNTIADAHALFEQVNHPAAFHLSTRQCPAHRRRVLAEVRRRLKAGEPVYLVSTQVVEAGVDVSFPLVLRALGPLDSLIQAAGRCNREGENPDGGRVVVFRPAEGKMPPGAYRAGTQQTEKLMEEARRREQDFADLLHTSELPPLYFRHLYPTQNLDRHDIQTKAKKQSFREIASLYRLIEDTVSVVVPYNPEDDLQVAQERDDILRCIEATGEVWRSDWRALQPCTVSLRHDLHERAVEEGLCYEAAPGLWRWTGRYDGDLQGLGLHFEASVEGLIVG